ncbi:MAG: right-handed parallel beta-helix repeat-containing protein [Planctomycetota bacterium]
MDHSTPHHVLGLAFLIAATALPAPSQSLLVSPTAPIGAPLVFTLATGAPSTHYLLDIGFHGISPGVVLPASNRVIPMNRPWSYLDLGGASQPAVFAGFDGVTDAAGRATATLQVPALPVLVGLSFHACYVTENPAAPDHVGLIVGPEQVTFVADQGWTNFAPSVDTRVVYVSTSTGNDANSGLDPLQAVRTVARGKSLVRHGYPDWLLFRRGDVWNETIGAWQKCGRSATERMVLGSYGANGARPLFQAGSSHGITFTGGGGSPATMDHVAVTGLDFWASGRDPGSPTFVGPGSSTTGLLFLRPGQDLLVEDCVFRFFGTNMVIQGEGTGLWGFTLRRCTLTDAYGIAGSYHAQGFYMHNGHQVVIEENVFDHNGWHGGVPGSQPTIYGHNLYIHWENSGVVVRRNLVARAGSHGLQLRSGGTVSDNVFLRNPIGILLGGDLGPHPSNPGNLVAGNVVEQGSNISVTQPRGWGMEIKRVLTPTVRDNVIAQCEGGMQVGIQLTDISVCTVANNTLHAWNGGNLASSPASNPGSVHHNIFSQGPAFGSNVMTTAVPYVDPWRTAASYQGALGGTATLDAFLLAARQQARHSWNPANTAAALRAYVRSGFRPTANLGSPQIGAVPYF